MKRSPRGVDFVRAGAVDAVHARTAEALGRIVARW